MQRVDNQASARERGTALSAAASVTGHDNSGPILEFYREFAKAEQCVVAGSVRLAVDGNIYNSMAFIGPDGEMLAAYHKTNLTVGEIEEGLRSGGGAVVVDSPVGRLGGVICFDLDFETLRDEYIALRPEILTFSTMYQGGLAQALWAYACRSYLVSALPFLGGGIIDPCGRPMQLTDEYNKPAIATINLDYVIVHLDYNREKFPDILRKYNDEIIIDIPAHVGSAMISSRSEDVSAADIVREFELELLDDYFARSKLANARNR
jgi:hypothetical protein